MCLIFFFNSTSNTYIGHVFSSNFAANAIKSCSIISNSALNVSDNYLLHTVIELCIKEDVILLLVYLAMLQASPG